jgi:CheY-like chemotaxis protein
MWFFSSRPKWPEVPVEELRRRARLLVIDDQVFTYKDLFERDGYTIERWPDVEDLPRLESGAFDLILLDLQGVAKELSAEQGLGLLRHLRKVLPTQLVIAYSRARDLHMLVRRELCARVADLTCVRPRAH